MTTRHYSTNAIFAVLLLLLISVQPIQLYAQSVIHGTIVDKNQLAVAHANVLLLNSLDSSLVKGSISSSSGGFKFENIKNGKYLVSSTFTGFAQVYSEIINLPATNPAIDIGKLALSQSTTQLKEVTVTAKKPLYEQLIDRTVINVENSITSSGGTALDVLARSPGITIDYQNNLISMNGKSGVVLMINGKPNYMPISAAVQLLAGMSSTNIEKIELITTPPANFDAEGNAGYINIVLKTNNNVGTNGSFSVMTGYGQGFLGSGSVFFNHRRGNINIYGDGTYRITYADKIYIKSFRRVFNKVKEIETNTRSDRNIHIPNFTGRLGMDYQLGKNTVAGVLINSYDNQYIMDAVNSSFIYSNKVLDSSISIINTENNHWSSFGGNINLQHNFSNDSKLSVNADYIHYNNDDPVNYSNSYYNNAGAFQYLEETKSGKVTPIDIIVGAIDYSKKLSAKASIDAGIKSTSSVFNNDVSLLRNKQNGWVKDDTLSSVYDLHESYHAAYTSINLTIDKNTEAKMGLRYEYTNSNLGTETQKDIVDRHYGNLFPTLFVSRKIDENNSINLAYSRRITRPTFNDLAPFTYYSDPNSLLTGNPALQPSITNQVKVNYSFYKYFLSLTYGKEDRAIEKFQPSIDSVTNKLINSAANLINRKTISLLFSFPIRVNNWWSMQYNLMGIWQEANAVYKSDDVRIRKANFTFNGTQSFTLPKKWTVELSGFFQSADVSGIYVMRPMGALDVGVRKKLKDNKSTLHFAVTNILQTMAIRLRADIPEQNLYSDVGLHFFYREYKFTYTRSFGKEKLKAKRDRTTGSEAERERVQ